MKRNKNLPTCIKNIPIDVQVAKELKTLSEDIKNDKNKLERTLEEIDSNTCSINIESNWYGRIKKSSLENTCQKIYSELSSYIKDCGKSIKKNNENLGRSLELIKLLAIVEKDLYEQIDDQIVRSNEFNESLLDWCKQQGINNDEVRGLLETSFHRAYTLRDRINTLRNESHNSITELGNRVGKLEEKADDVCRENENEIKRIIQEYENKLEKEREVLKKIFNKKIIYAIFGSVTLSSLISLLVTTLLH